MTNRNAALDALVEVLRSVPGIQYVDRQAVVPNMVADAQLPAILVDEVRTRYGWIERHGSRRLKFDSVIVLDCQVRAIRRADGPGSNASTVRESFINTAMYALSNNPTLNVQLEGEPEATEHAYDSANEFEVRYVRVEAPYARGLITFQLSAEEIMDGRTVTDWQQLIVDIHPCDEEAIKTLNFDLET